MINTIKIIVLVFLFALANKSVGQDSISTECTKDSIFYKNFLTYTDTGTFAMHHRLKIKEFLPEKEQDCFCALLVYVKIFDFLLKNNVDLEFSALKDPPIIISSVMSPNPEAAIKLQTESSISLKKGSVYRMYIFMKKMYEETVVAQYEADKSRSLEQDVNNVLRYGIYAYPATLKGILLTKNADALKAKYDKEMSMLFDQD